MTTATSSDKQYNVIQNPIGFYEVTPKPSPQELKEYYAEHFYQEAHGNYELEYSEAERAYIMNKIDQKYRVISRFLKKEFPRGYKLLDVGCGEGWSLSYYKQKGWEVTGLDFSSYGCKKFNPDCSDNLIAGDVYENLQGLIDSGKQYDCVWLLNVLEHVIDPMGLLNSLKQAVRDGGILMVQVPNDYSQPQQYLKAEGYISKEYWVAPPTHLSYFNTEGLRAIMAHTGWQEEFLMSDYWIELNLFNTQANYVENGTVGKAAHHSRIAIENLLHDISPEKTIELYQKAAEVGLGRNLMGFYVKP